MKTRVLFEVKKNFFFGLCQSWSLPDENGRSIRNASLEKVRECQRLGIRIPCCVWSFAFVYLFNDVLLNYY